MASCLSPPVAPWDVTCQTSSFRRAVSNVPKVSIAARGRETAVASFLLNVSGTRWQPRATGSGPGSGWTSLRHRDTLRLGNLRWTKKQWRAESACEDLCARVLMRDRDLIGSRQQWGCYRIMRERTVKIFFSVLQIHFFFFLVKCSKNSLLSTRSMKLIKQRNNEI